MATERIQTLEDNLARAEAEKCAARDALEYAESQLKNIHSESGRRGGGEVGDGGGAARRHCRLARHARAEREDSGIYSDEEEESGSGRYIDSPPRRNDGHHAIGRRDYGECCTRAEDKGTQGNSFGERGRYSLDHKTMTSNAYLRKQDEDEFNSPQHMLRTLEAAARQNMEDYYMDFSDDELSRCTSALAIVSSKVEEAKRLSLQRKEKDLADSKLSNAENSLCCICRDATKTILLLPCRHLCLCEDCSETLQQRRGTCPVCREVVQDTLRVFA